MPPLVADAEVMSFGAPPRGGDAGRAAPPPQPATRRGRSLAPPCRERRRRLGRGGGARRLPRLGGPPCHAPGRLPPRRRGRGGRAATGVGRAPVRRVAPSCAHPGARERAGRRPRVGRRGRRAVGPPLARRPLHVRQSGGPPHRRLGLRRARHARPLPPQRRVRLPAEHQQHGHRRHPLLLRGPRRPAGGGGLRRRRPRRSRGVRASDRARHDPAAGESSDRKDLRGSGRRADRPGWDGDGVARLAALRPTTGVVHF